MREIKKPKLLERFNKPLAALAGSLAMLGALGASYDKLNNDVGLHEAFKSRVPNNNPLSGNIKIVFLNIEDKSGWYKDIKKLKPDLLLSAEVDGSVASTLHSKLPNYYADWVKADSIQHLLSGGYGDEIFSLTKPIGFKS